MTRDPFAADGVATNPNPQKIEYPACDRCGSPNVSADAAARWDHQAQDWRVTNVFDKGHSCDDCCDGCGIKWVEGNLDDEPKEEPCPSCCNNPDVMCCGQCGKGMVF